MNSTVSLSKEEKLVALMDDDDVNVGEYEKQLIEEGRQSKIISYEKFQKIMKG
jgi:hypothetical protein